jgi:hypothetical protein
VGVAVNITHSPGHIAVPGLALTVTPNGKAALIVNGPIAVDVALGALETICIR